MSSLYFALLALRSLHILRMFDLPHLLAILCVAIALSGAEGARLHTAPALEEEKERTFDFGVQVVGGEVRHSFFIANSGKQLLALGRITIDCSCTKVVSQPQSIAPGERGELVVVTKPEKVGVSNITIIAETTTGNPAPAATPATSTSPATKSGISPSASSSPSTSTATNTSPSATSPSAKSAPASAISAVATPAPTGYLIFRLTGVVMAKAPEPKVTETKAAEAKPPVPAAVVPSLSAADIAAISISAKEVLEALKMAAASSTAIATTNPAPATATADIVLVDLRSQEHFTKVRIKGSVNMTPLGLMARHDYKDKALIVVIDDGTGTAALPTRLQRLKNAGWKNVRLLQGGLRAWQLAGGPLEGAAPQSAAIATASPAAFYERQHSTEIWLVITTSGPSSSTGSASPTLDNGTTTSSAPPASTFPTRFPIVSAGALAPSATSSAVADPAAAQVFARQIQDALKAHPEAQKILITDPDGKSLDRLEAVLRPLCLPVPYYYMDGGTTAFTVFSRQQTQLLQARQVTLGNQAVTHTSEQTRGPVVRGAGCGTCSK